ncbi:type I restriction endonuclease subunit R [Lyngbya aestuarii]|uniref:type I restriction endonuclease subunit R n=1 Tax=Lyngbya aestuarii TaxID=118322 RepID=UPI00403E0A60
MVQTKPISKTITSLFDLRERFNLSPTNNDQFSPEFTQDLPKLTDSETATLDQIRNRFIRHRERGSLAEGTINHLVISPLLTLAGLYDEPFFITTEPEVELLLEDKDELLRGRIDTLIIQQQLWVLVVESKSTIAFSVALPQALTYLMANPNPERPVYGLITNGDEFQFIKLLIQDNPQYDLSNIFSLLVPHRNQLYDIMRVLKQIRQIMLQNLAE